MIFAYDARGMSLRARGLLVAMGVAATPFSVQLQGSVPSVPSQAAKPLQLNDPRVERLHEFLRRLHCPVAGMAEDFIRVADENHLDWRLLPSIAIMESGGGKAYRNNNIFGWGGGHLAFPSIRDGLELVASKLGQSPLYKRLDSLGKLHIYNENKEYADSVTQLMNRMSRSAN